MKKCLKCININLLPEDYALASTLHYVVEDKPGHLYGELTTPPLCILYGKIVEDYTPCPQCIKNNSYTECIKERK